MLLKSSDHFNNFSVRARAESILTFIFSPYKNKKKKKIRKMKKKVDMNKARGNF